MSLPEIGQWKSLDELAGLQDKQLPTVFEWAAGSPFYRKRFGPGAFPRGRSDLESVPLTTKQELRDNYPFGMLAVPKERLATYHESSGTAGTPTPSYYTAEDWVDLAERYARKWIGISPSDVFMVRTPYALMITGHLAQAAARSKGATVVPGDNRSLAMPYSRVVKTLHNLGVTLTWSMPTEPLIWAAAAREAGWDPGSDFPALRAFFIGGEPVSDARRRRISEIWGVPLVEEYGSTETGSLAGECEHGHMHLWSDRAIFEVYDPASGEIRQEGSGELVVTPLYREAMPLLRYNLADNVEVSYEPCACGWALPTVRVLGRAAFGYRVGGVKVTQHRLEDRVFSLPKSCGVMFWRAKADPDVLRVEIEADDGYADKASAELTAAVRDEFGAGLSVDVKSVPKGTLVPLAALTSLPDVVKPRSLFGPEEDWGKALLYY